MAVTVLRQYKAYDLIDAKSWNVTLDITMKITEKQPVILLPVDGYRVDLKITDAEGRNMIILSDHEFEEEYGSSMNKINNEFLKKLGQDADDGIKKLTTKHRIIAVILNNDENSDKYYKKIKVQWKEKANIKNEGGFVKHSEMRIDIPRYGFKQNSSSAIYLSIRTGSKHEISKKPVITDRKGDKIDYITIFDSTNHKVYRFDETAKPQLIHVIVKARLPKIITRWATLGLIVAGTVPTSLIAFILITKNVPEFTFELMAGVIALLIGERVLIFRDIPLMKSWSTAHFISTIICIIVLVSLMIIPELFEWCKMEMDC